MLNPCFFAAPEKCFQQGCFGLALICSQKMVWIRTYNSGTHKCLSFLGPRCPNQIFQFRPRRVDRIRAKLQGMGTFTFDYTFDTCPGVKTLYQVQVKVPPKNNVLASPMIFFPIEDGHFWLGNLLFLCLLTKEQYQSRIHKPPVHEYEVRHYQLDLSPSESAEILYCSW